jgi:hypothetical protein
VLTVRRIQVRSLSTDYAIVTWQIDPTAEDLSGYRFFVLRCEGEAGPYIDLSGPLEDLFLWRDNTAFDGRRWRDFYYRIRVVHLATGDYAEYGRRDPKEVFERGLDPGGVSKEPEPSLVGREIARRQRLLLRTTLGRPIIVFQVRTFGQRCPSCWDPLKQQKTLSYCASCYGSSFNGGYFRPILTYGQVVEQVMASEPTMIRIEPGEALLRLDNFPHLKPQDVVVEIENTRWRVARVQPSEHQRALISQSALLTRIGKKDVEYRLPIQGIDPVRLDLLNEHEYLGAANPEAFSEYRNRLLPPKV